MSLLLLALHLDLQLDISADMWSSVVLEPWTFASNLLFCFSPADDSDFKANHSALSHYSFDYQLLSESL